MYFSVCVCDVIYTYIYIYMYVDVSTFDFLCIRGMLHAAALAILQHLDFIPGPAIRN